MIIPFNDVDIILVFFVSAIEMREELSVRNTEFIGSEIKHNRVDYKQLRLVKLHTILDWYMCVAQLASTALIRQQETFLQQTFIVTLLNLQSYCYQN